MDLGLAGQVALVTGGSRGIGAAVCRALAREGCDVAFNFVGPEDEAQEVVASAESLGRRALAVQADVASHEGAHAMVRTVVERLGRLDILVCNAGITWDGPIWKMTEEQWDAVIATNLKGCFNYNHAAASVFRDQRSGKVVNVSSINGMRGKFAQTNYAASKAGVIALTKSLARELGRYNVNVNAVAPGLVMTGMAAKMPPEYLQKAVDETVLGRAATPEECADIVVFLCSDRARHVTGEVVKIDGGQSI